ncbi:MAG: M23 family metallopeptidase [bacterium]|nr:M23 family metallopeptidase [bacterium]
MDRTTFVTILAIALATTVGIHAANAYITPRSTPYSLDPTDDAWSHIDFPFASTTTGWGHWIMSTTSWCHNYDDKWAEDWEWTGGGPEAGLGKTIYAPGPGTVIYAGYTSTAHGYGNQVVVQLFDHMSMAVRYAHLETIAVEVGDQVNFGSEIGSLGDSGDQAVVHLHLVVYRNIYSHYNGISGRDRLADGLAPSGIKMCGNPGGATQYSAKFDAAGIPYSIHPNEEDLPCNMWNGDIVGCVAHSIANGQYTQDCAYYSGSDLCLPRGTSFCRGYIHEYCTDGSFWNDSDESLPCHHWDGDQFACDVHGYDETRSCAFYWGPNKCRPRGTSNCLVGIWYYCYN